MLIMRASSHWILISENIKDRIRLLLATPALAAGVVFQRRTMQIYTAQTYELPAAVQEQVSALLDSERRARVRNIRSAKERARSIFAGLLLRHAFLQAGHTVSEWEAAELGKGRFGKPYIDGYPDFHFGLSHSGNWAACAVDSKPVGIDIQEMKPWKMTLAKRFYHEREYNRLLALEGVDQDRQTEEFYSMWTAKESAVKLSGRGIGAGISRYVTVGDYQYIYDADGGQAIPMRRYAMLKGYMLCVCSRTAVFPDVPEQINFEYCGSENIIK